MKTLLANNYTLSQPANNLPNSWIVIEKSGDFLKILFCNNMNNGKKKVRRSMNF